MRTSSTWLPSASRAVEHAFATPRGRLVDMPPSGASQALLVTCSMLIVAGLIWSFWGELDVVATGTGRVEPLLHTKTVQPLQAGIVEQIFVADGDHVRAGQPLLQLDDAQDQADARKASEDALQACLDVARIHALQQAARYGTMPMIGKVSAASSQEIAATIERMQDQYVHQMAKLADLDQQIAEKTNEIQETAAQISQSEAMLPFLVREESIRDETVRLGVGSRIDELEIGLRATQQREASKVLAAHALQAAATIRSLRQQRVVAIREYESVNWDELEKAQAILAQAQDDASKAKERIQAQTLRAPVDGTVQQLVVTTRGGVVTAAEPLLSVVPDDNRLTVDIVLKNHDIGFVHIGQHVQVKIETFAYTRYGVLPGTVINVSRDAVIQDHARPERGVDEDVDGDLQDTKNLAEDGYVAKVSLDRSWVKTEFGRQSLDPGMEVSADILTGRRRVISYLLSPLQGTLREGMREH